MENQEMRDMLAMVAMQSILSDKTARGSARGDENILAERSYEIADAMIKARGE